jgi:hypothetical protein
MHKRDVLARASALVRDGSGSSLRYASLELRFCLELIAYEKVRIFAPRLPPSLYKRWQPPQLFRALEQLEPGSAHDRVVRFSRKAVEANTPVEWHTLGVHKTIRVTQMTKLYNTLGSYLHAPMPRPDGRIEDRSPAAADLNAVIEILKPVVESKFDGMMAEVFSFPCDICGIEVVGNSAGAAVRGSMECLNPQCGAAYHIYAVDGHAETYELDATEFECISCKMPTTVQNRVIGMDATFQCRHCREEHIFLKMEWGYARTRDVSIPET